MMTYKMCIDHFEALCNAHQKPDFIVKYVVLEASGKDASQFYLQMNHEVEPKVLESIQNIIENFIFKDIPIDYSLGYAYFYGYKWYVNPHVLIPRNETEELVEHCIILLDTMPKKPKVLDLGSGSGCIGLTIKKEVPQALVTLSDISNDALDVMIENAKRLEVDVEMILSDWFSQIQGTFDLIVSNPPYLLLNETLGITVSSEPKVALYGGMHGLEHYETILKSIKPFMHDDTIIAFEHGYQQAESLQKLIHTYLEHMDVVTIQDMQGVDRMTFAVKKPNKIPFEGVRL
jgi:release factor glutamine methyltransferase